MRILGLVVLYILSANTVPGYKYPNFVNDQSTTAPLCAVMTYDRYNGDLILHAALYPDGQLYWTKGYFDYKTPDDMSCCDSQDQYTYSVYKATIPPNVVEQFKSDILALMQTTDWGIRVYNLHPGLPVTELLFNTGQQSLFMRSGDAADLGKNFQNWLAENDPSITPVPTPVVSVFLQDWSFIEQELFDLVAANVNNGTLLNSVLFKTEYSNVP